MTHNDFNHLLHSIKALSPDQMQRLRQELDSALAASASGSGSAALTEAELSDQELQRRLYAKGVLSEVKPPRRVASETERLTPIPIQGEPLSETVIRERR